VAEIVPFHGLRFDESVVGDIGSALSPPFDVIAPTEQEDLYRRSQYNVVRLELPKDEPGDNPAQNKYQRAKAVLDQWQESGALKVDYAPSFYLHDHHFVLDGRRLRRRGFFGALRLYEWGRGVVRPHEQTFSGPKVDRLRLLRLTRVNTSAIFLLVDDAEGRIARALDDAMAHGPARLVADARLGDERHLLFQMDDRFANDRLASLFADKRLYIADGHHRYETALEYWREETKAGRVEVENDTSCYVLSYFVATQDPGLRILPTHRVVRGADEALREAAEVAFHSNQIDAGGIEDQQPPIAVAHDGKIEALTLRPDTPLETLPESWRGLPVAEADEFLLKPARERGAEITYTHDAGAALQAAREGATSVLVRPVDAATLLRVADAWQRLPQKTTYFYPKVPTGLVMRPLGA
jgi:uncharacterized protein (DUF1015 family)